MSQQVKIYRKLEFGTSTQRITTEQASYIFSEHRLTTSAASGYNHGIYVSMRHTSTSTEFSAARFYAINTGTVTSGSIHSLWATFEASTGGTNSGLSAAGRFTTTAVANVGLTGTHTVIQLDWTIAASNSQTGNESFIRFENVGAATLDGFFLDGVTLDTTNMMVASTTEANYAMALKCRLNGTPYWLMFASASG